MNLSLTVQCTHTERKFQKNIDMEFLEELSSNLGGVFKCPICKRETVVFLQEGAE